MAVSTPIRRVILTANESKKKISQGRDAIKSVGQVILKRTKVKREAFAQTNIFRKRREENEKRQTLEDELEAPRVVMTPTGPQQLIQATGAGGFFKRILGFIGYLAAGWIMNNLPTWIAMGEEFIARLQRAGEIVSEFFNNTIKLFTNVGNILGALGQNLMQFDFFDTSNRVKNAMGELNDTMGNLTGQIEEAFDLLTTPLTEGKYSGEEIPKTGTQQTDEGAYTEPPPYSGSGGGSPDFWTLAAVTSLEDGDPQGRADVAQSIYNRAASGVFGSSSIRAIILSGNGKQYEPVGRAVKEFNAIQDRESAIKAIMVANKLSRKQAERMIDDTVSAITNPSLQKKAAEFVENRTDFLGAGLTPNRSSSTELRRRNPSDNIFGNYVGPASYQYGLRSRGKASSPNIQLSTTTTTQALTPRRGITTTVRDEVDVVRNTSPLAGLTPGQGFGAARRGGRLHKGIDIGTYNTRGFYVSFRQSGKVTYARNNGEGYGNLVIIKSGNTEFYFAHLARIMVKEGQSYNGETIGEIGNTGGDYSIHLHFEARPNGNPVNPKPYLNLLSIGRQLTGIAGKPTTVVPESPAQPSPAQIAAPAQQTNAVPFSLTPERSGQDIIIIDQPRQQQNIITSASGGGGQGPSAISDFDLLNNFIKNKLLLDLAYV
jgi:murein DD-endopeptidase MepM/ murein hydrolase activator NlpD